MRVENMEDIIHKLHLIPHGTGRIIRSSLTEAGKAVRKSQRQMAAPHDRTGNLKRSIGTVVRFHRRKQIMTVYVGPRTNFVAGNGQPATRYAFAIQFGWDGHDKDPFMTRSWEANKHRLASDFRTGFGKAIERLAAKGKLPPGFPQ